MNKEPFVITLGNEDLPNLSQGGENDFGIEFQQTNLWRDDDIDKIKLLNRINEKLDVIIRLMKQSGKG
ncbi:MAG: hypothetical protein IJ410_02795 [Oscillospiraceae bacterium]|nr:hypothetical protein [Oscillospiraceae bacterium]